MAYNLSEESKVEDMVKLSVDGKEYKCEQCKYDFTAPRGLKRHMLVHSIEKPYKCKVCDKYFKYKRSLSEHSIIHFEDNNGKSNICQNCGKGFRVASYLRDHGRKFCNKKFLKLKEVKEIQEALYFSKEKVKKENEINSDVTSEEGELIPYVEEGEL